MELEFNELENGIRLIEVDYILSMEVHMLITAANSIAGRGGKMALLNAKPTVLDVLHLSGILQVIPIYSHLESAKAGL